MNAQQIRTAMAEAGHEVVSNSSYCVETSRIGEIEAMGEEFKVLDQYEGYSHVEFFTLFALDFQV